jgi:hypothetical protein
MGNDQSPSTNDQGTTNSQAASPAFEHSNILEKLFQSPALIPPLPARNERIEERGILNKNAPPLPDPLLHFAEEREKNQLPGAV